jgi:lysophospholipase L1-like esterase
MVRLTRRSFLLLAFMLAAPALFADEFDHWQLEIKAIEAHDKEHPPTPGGTVYVGSSTIRMWDLPKAGLEGVNHGFGGSQVIDSVHFFDRLVAAAQPGTIVFYAGGNDLAGGKSPQQVADDYKKFVALAHEKLPKAKLFFIATNPSASRWKLADKQRELNKIVKQLVDADPLQGYIDVFDQLLGPDGQPNPDYFRDDRLHLSEAGYKILTAATKAALATKP